MEKFQEADRAEKGGTESSGPVSCPLISRHLASKNSDRRTCLLPGGLGDQEGERERGKGRNKERERERETAQSLLHVRASIPWPSSSSPRVIEGREGEEQMRASPEGDW